MEEGRTRPRRVDRRTFLAWWIGGLLTATVVAITGPILVYVWAPKPRGQKDEALDITLPTALDAVPPHTAVEFSAPQGTAFIMTTGGGDNAPGDPCFGGFVVKPEQGSPLEAFSNHCPHLGCSVAFDTSAHIFKCPCHGSEFDIHGNVIHGPAVAPLARLGWHRGAHPNQIVVKSLLIGKGE